MICDHPECNGRHGGDKKWALRCPASKKKSIATRLKYRDTHWLNYVKALMRNRRNRALKRVEGRKEQYGKIS